MTDEKKRFGLASREDGAPAPVLCGVRADGRLDGLLFELTLRQTCRNTSQDLLEVVYTFPMPSQAVLLGFASELNGRRQIGVGTATGRIRGSPPSRPNCSPISTRSTWLRQRLA
jgi:Ca-activated chloride channel family protein